MSEVKWNDRDSERVTFTTDAPKASEALNQVFPISERLESRIELKAATLSGKETRPEQAGKQSHSGIAPQSFSRPAVSAANRSVIITPSSSSSQVSQLSEQQSVSFNSDSDPATGIEHPMSIPVAGSSSSGSLNAFAKSAYAVSHRRGKQGVSRKIRSCVNDANELFSGVSGDDPVAQGSATAVRGAVHAATAVENGVRFGAWSWKTSLAFSRGVGNFVSLIRTQGLIKAASTVISTGLRAAVASATPIVGVAAVLLLIIVSILSVLSAVFGVGTDMSFGVPATVVDDLYAYCTEKDADLTVQIRQTLDANSYVNAQLYYNGALIEDTSDFSIETNINQLLIYLQAANSSGTHTVEELKAQIDEIYAAIYGIETEEVLSSGNSIATAAVLLAYKTPVKNDNGTALYQAVHDLTQSNNLYQSCDRVASSIIRWCGADDNFPTGLAGLVYTYLRDDGQGIGKGQWMKLPDNWTREDLQPGDVLIWKNHKHVFIYVGHDLIEARWPDLTDENYCVVEGSFHTPFAAACNKWANEDYNSYVYRNIKAEANPKYVNGIPGVNPTVSTVNINITAVSLSQYISDHVDADIQEHIDLINEFGTYAGYAIGGNPFGNGQHWTVTERFGSYADGSNIVQRNYVTVWASPGRKIYSPLTGALSWSGSTAAISSISSTGSLQQIVISGLSPTTESGSVSAGTQIGTAVSDSITISYIIDDNYVNPVIYLANPPGSGSAAIVDMALTQLGQQGGKPYWSWYGFSSRVSWCACFVSWCADQCDLISSGLIPKYSLCSDGAAWFQQNGQWAGRGYAPSPGDIIFFVNSGDTESHHTGIVMSCDGSTVQTIEGNSGDAVRIRTYNINSTYILGYGLPAYS